MIAHLGLPPSPVDPYNVLSGFSDSSTVPIYNFCWRKALWEMRVSCAGTQHSNHAKDRIQHFNPLATVSHTTESNELTLFFQCSPFIYLSCQFLYFLLSINHSFKIAKFKTF